MYSFDGFLSRRKNLDNELRSTYAQTMQALATDTKINGGERAIDDRLVAMAERLGVPPPEMKLDAEAVHEAAQLQKAMPSDAAIAQASKSLVTAAESVLRIREENQRALARAEAELRAALLADKLLNDAWRESRDRINQLHRERPRAFGLQPPPQWKPSKEGLTVTHAAPQPPAATPAKPIFPRWNPLGL